MDDKGDPNVSEDWYDKHIKIISICQQLGLPAYSLFSRGFAGCLFQCVVNAVLHLTGTATLPRVPYTWQCDACVPDKTDNFGLR